MCARNILVSRAPPHPRPGQPPAAAWPSTPAETFCVTPRRRAMRFCILADDLTGANATAALLKREGLPTHTHLFAHPPHGGAPAALREDGAHVLDLDTRERPGRRGGGTGWQSPPAGSAPRRT